MSIDSWPNRQVPEFKAGAPIQSVWHRLSIAILIISIESICALSSVLAADKALPHIDSLRASYVESVTSIRTMDYQIELQWESYQGPPPSPDTTKSISLHLIRDGVKEAVSETSFPFVGDWTMKNWWSFDGRKYASSFTRADSNGNHLSTPTAEIAFERPVMFRAWLTIEKLLGQSLWGGPTNLADLLNRPDDVRVLGWQEVRGHPCVHIDLGQHPRYDRKPETLAATSAWFDPNHGFLPRRILTKVSGADSKQNENYRDMEVEEFLSVSDAVNPNKTHWIPAKGSSRNPRSGFRLELGEVRVNAPIDPMRFEPEFVEGTTVSNRLQSPTKVSYIGGEAAARKISEKLEKTPPAAVDPSAGASPSKPSVSARPSEQVGWSVASASKWIAMLLVVAALILIVRSRLRT